MQHSGKFLPYYQVDIRDFTKHKLYVQSTNRPDNQETAFEPPPSPLRFEYVRWKFLSVISVENCEIYPEINTVLPSI